MQKASQLLEKQKEEIHKRDLEKTDPKHERLCSYWAGCDPIIGEEGYCDCKPRQTTLDEFN